MKFLESTRKPRVIYTDNSLEFGKSCEELFWNYCTSTPHRSETNGIAKRAVIIVKEGTSAVLLLSGLGNEWWADSMECYCYLRNIQDLFSDGKTPYERRFGIPFNGPVIPFGAMVEYHPISVKDLSRFHQFGLKSLARHIPWICATRGRNLERKHIDRLMNNQTKITRRDGLCSLRQLHRSVFLRPWPRPQVLPCSLKGHVGEVLRCCPG